jgi:hypothetical protein
MIEELATANEKCRPLNEEAQVNEAAGQRKWKRPTGIAGVQRGTGSLNTELNVKTMELCVLEYVHLYDALISRWCGFDRQMLLIR